ncbi:MAG: hypothetical protein AABZ22_08855, partial [Nitrospirota bacterium]
CCDPPARALDSGQAGGLATQSVNVLTTRCILQSNGSPVRLLLARTRRVPIALLLQWVDATRLRDFATNRHE